jgi:hypothetical protein
MKISFKNKEYPTRLTLVALQYQKILLISSLTPLITVAIVYTVTIVREFFRRISFR